LEVGVPLDFTLDVAHRSHHALLPPDASRKRVTTQAR
jgi:hypothetical protein